jgi:hypothetical protein
MKNEIRLASNWPISRVRTCFRRKDKGSLIQFIRERHRERFFDPISRLKSAPGNVQGYGFAIMAICALLVETIESYKEGLPTTFGSDLDNLRAKARVPARYQIPPALTAGGGRTFKRFFRAYNPRFPKLTGYQFYQNIRNGLLHQAQTKRKWTLRKWGPISCDVSKKIIYRDKFAEQLVS